MAATEPEPFYGIWTSNKTQICYEGENNEAWCGNKDKCSTLGLILPIFSEETWPTALRGTLYLIGLLYSFLGVSIVADIFMCAIEKITSKTKQIHFATPKGDSPEVIEVPVWNGTVANLTLMALGSSAPEILLNVIEIIGNNFEAGQLGPGTIVGSAAFNLLAISAVCIIGIPNGETRRIDQIIVFGITATFSVLAYIWLLVILKWVSPDEVELWEAILTFVFFPILVLIAYCADKQWLHPLFGQSKTTNSDKQRQIELGNFTPGEGMYQFIFPFSLGCPIRLLLLLLLLLPLPLLSGGILTSVSCFGGSIVPCYVPHPVPSSPYYLDNISVLSPRVSLIDLYRQLWYPLKPRSSRSFVLSFHQAN